MLQNVGFRLRQWLHCGENDTEGDIKFLTKMTETSFHVGRPIWEVRIVLAQKAEAFYRWIEAVKHFNVHESVPSKIRICRRDNFNSITDCHESQSPFDENQNNFTNPVDRGAANVL